MFKHKSYFLLFFLAGMIMACSGPKDEFEKRISFDRNLVETGSPELVCNLSEDSILLKNIKHFTLLSDSSFVVIDGRGAYLYHISGKFKKQFGESGQAGGEMLSPSLVYATSDFVYIWCSSMMKFLIFDHEANFKEEISSFERAVKKFVVDSSDTILYLYTSGTFDEAENATTNVICVYNRIEKTSKTYGARSNEEEVLSTFINSGGLYADADRLLFLHPGNLIIYDLNTNSDEMMRYKIEDNAFRTTELTAPVRDIMSSRSKLTDYLHTNSLVNDIQKHKDQFIIVSEIGSYEFDEQSRVMNTEKRKVKLYILDSSLNPDRTILFDYISSPNVVVRANSLYFITQIINDEQTFTLNRKTII